MPWIQHANSPNWSLRIFYSTSVDCIMNQLMQLTCYFDRFINSQDLQGLLYIDIVTRK